LRTLKLFHKMRNGPPHGSR